MTLTESVQGRTPPSHPPFIKGEEIGAVAGMGVGQGGGGGGGGDVTDKLES